MNKTEIAAMVKKYRMNCVWYDGVDKLRVTEFAGDSKEDIREILKANKEQIVDWFYENGMVNIDLPNYDMFKGRPMFDCGIYTISANKNAYSAANRAANWIDTHVSKSDRTTFDHNVAYTVEKKFGVRVSTNYNMHF